MNRRLGEKKEEIVELSPKDLGSLRDKRDKNTKIYGKEEAYWYQRVRCKQLREGDLNTAFFHATANVRKRSNNILSIREGEQMIKGKKEITVVGHNFKKFMFSSTIENRWNFNGNPWLPNT